jgi:hypothetical protein
LQQSYSGSDSREVSLLLLQGMADYDPLRNTSTDKLSDMKQLKHIRPFSVASTDSTNDDFSSSSSGDPALIQVSRQHRRRSNEYEHVYDKRGSYKSRSTMLKQN